MKSDSLARLPSRPIQNAISRAVGMGTRITIGSSDCIMNSAAFYRFALASGVRLGNVPVARRIRNIKQFPRLDCFLRLNAAFGFHTKIRSAPVGDFRRPKVGDGIGTPAPYAPRGPAPRIAGSNTSGKASAIAPRAARVPVLVRFGDAGLSTLSRENVVHRAAPPSLPRAGLQTFGVKHVCNAVITQVGLAQSYHTIQDRRFPVVIAEWLATFRTVRFWPSCVDARRDASPRSWPFHIGRLLQRLAASRFW